MKWTLSFLLLVLFTNLVVAIEVNKTIFIIDDQNCIGYYGFKTKTCTSNATVIFRFEQEEGRYKDCEDFKIDVKVEDYASCSFFGQNSWSDIVGSMSRKQCYTTLEKIRQLCSARDIINHGWNNEILDKSWQLFLKEDSINPQTIGKIELELVSQSSYERRNNLRVAYYLVLGIALASFLFGLSRSKKYSKIFYAISIILAIISPLLDYFISDLL